IAEGSVFESQTDTEVIAHLMAKYLREGLQPQAALLKMLNRVSGAFALAVMLKDHPNTIMAARSGPPLAIGHGKGEMFL
ncbi:glutamine--fructose-6-phosphate aminotransferase, partial [Arthrobacter sp. SIMBA_036]